MQEINISSRTNNSSKANNVANNVLVRAEDKNQVLTELEKKIEEKIVYQMLLGDELETVIKNTKDAIAVIDFIQGAVNNKGTRCFKYAELELIEQNQIAKFFIAEVDRDIALLATHKKSYFGDPGIKYNLMGIINCTTSIQKLKNFIANIDKAKLNIAANSIIKVLKIDSQGNVSKDSVLCNNTQLQQKLLQYINAIHNVENNPDLATYSSYLKKEVYKLLEIILANDLGEYKNFTISSFLKYLYNITNSNDFTDEAINSNLIGRLINDYSFDFTKPLTYEEIENIVPSSKMMYPNSIFPEFASIIFGTANTVGYLDYSNIGKAKRLNKSWNKAITDLNIPYKTYKLMLDKQAFNEQKWQLLLSEVQYDDLIRIVTVDCTTLKEIHVTQLLELINRKPNIKKLDIRNVEQNNSLSILGTLKNITKLAITNCRGFNLVSLVGISDLLTELSLDNINLADINMFTNLTSLTLKNYSFTNVDMITQLVKLTSLNLYKCERLVNINAVANLVNLTSLDLSYCEKLTNIDRIANLVNLTILDLSDCASLTNINAIANLVNLTILDLRNCENLIIINSVANLINLAYLHLKGCKNLKASDITKYTKKLTRLKTLIRD